MRDLRLLGRLRDPTHRPAKRGNDRPESPPRPFTSATIMITGMGMDTMATITTTIMTMPKVTLIPISTAPSSRWNRRSSPGTTGWRSGSGAGWPVGTSWRLNLVSSPGAGKTTLLERTISDLGREISISVIEGDQQTLHDAQRIQATGCRVVQINTGTACHLDASMMGRALQQLDPPRDSVVMIENVGNLVCPALFDLGERAKVVIVSVTEGDDKPIKYPHMFRASEVMILNKIDLLPYVQFDVERCLDFARRSIPRSRSSSSRRRAAITWMTGMAGSARTAPGAATKDS